MPTIIVNEFRVNTHTNDRQDDPAIATLANGNYVVVWSSYNQDVSSASSYGIYAQLFNASGSALGSEFRVNTYTSGLQQYPYIAALTNGNFVVAWNSNNQDGSTGGVYSQLYNGSGGLVGSEFRVNTNTTGNQNDPSIAALANGKFVVVWVSNGQDGSGAGVYGQLFSASGSPIGSEFQVNAYTTGDQADTAIAAFANENFVVAWASNGQDGSNYGVCL